MAKNMYQGMLGVCEVLMGRVSLAFSLLFSHVAIGIDTVKEKRRDENGQGGGVPAPPRERFFNEPTSLDLAQHSHPSCISPSEQPCISCLQRRLQYRWAAVSHSLPRMLPESVTV